MKRTIPSCLALLVILALPSRAQENSTLPESYKTALNRLQSLTVYPETEWRFHVDVPHPEDLSLNDSAWEQMKEGDSWKNGGRVLRRWIEIPKTINGYDVAGSRVEFDLRFDGIGGSGREISGGRSSGRQYRKHSTGREQAADHTRHKPSRPWSGTNRNPGRESFD